jgi:hypothetical protein
MMQHTLVRPIKINKVFVISLDPMWKKEDRTTIDKLIQTWCKMGR